MADAIKSEFDTNMLSLSAAPATPEVVEETPTVVNPPASQPEQVPSRIPSEQVAMGPNVSTPSIKVEPEEPRPTAFENHLRPRIIIVPSTASRAEVDVTEAQQTAPGSEVQAQSGIDNALTNLAVTSPAPREDAPVRRSNTKENRVAAKEEAVQEALKGLESIRAKLAIFPVANADNFVPNWMSQLKTLNADNKKFEFLVGAAGSTGMGKSSLLNALIGQADDLAPSSQNGACTAAVCCFRYQDPKTAERTYVAKVSFKSKETVDRELTNFFDDYREWFDDSRLDGQLDSDVQAQRDHLQGVINIIQGWSRLDKDKIIELGTTDRVSEITTQCVQGSQLFNYKKPNQNEVRIIGSNLARNFLQEIRPYIGNTKKKLETLLWPLVEIVNIYLDASILRDGIVLVDLPGESDAVESRAQVARDYYDRVDRLMIITPSDRACDNQTAAGLIRDDQVVDLEAGGKMSADGVCVVVTKIDLMDWEAFVAQEWQPSDVSQDFPMLMEGYEELQEELTELQDEIKELRESLDGRSSVSNRFRRIQITSVRRITETTSPEDAAKMERLASLEERLEWVQLRWLDRDEQCLRACIDARNRDIEEKMREDIQRRRQDMLGDRNVRAPGPVNVFPVSSHAHRSILKGKTELAFPNAESTGVPALEKWMREGSLRKRGRHAAAILTRCQVLYEQISEWFSEEWLVQYRLPQSEFPRIREILKASANSRRQKLENWALEAATLLNMHEAFKARLDGPLPWKNQGTFKAHIRSFHRSEDGGELHWGTYSACIRRRGATFKTRSRTPTTYDWQGSTYTLYWKPHLGYWSRTFNQEFTSNGKKIITMFNKINDDHMEQILKSPEVPQAYKDALQQHKDKLEAAGNSSRLYIKQATDKLRSESQEIRQKSRHMLNGASDKAYEEAQNHIGKRRYARQIASLESHANHVCETIHSVVKEDLYQMLRGAHEDLVDELLRRAELHESRMYQIEETVATYLCSLDTKILEDSTSLQEVDKLKKSILQDVDVWAEKSRALKLKKPRKTPGPLEKITSIVKATKEDSKGHAKRRAADKDAGTGAPPAKAPRLH